MLADLDFTDEQKQYLTGFVAGAESARSARGLPTFAATLGLSPEQLPGGASGGMRGSNETKLPDLPEFIHRRAQDRFLALGRKLSPEEEGKRRRNPLDMWEDLRQHAAAEKFPKGTDVFAFKFHGLFFVAPAQNAYMCRLRFPAGIITSWQLRGLADLADEHAGGYADITTRANLQLREIPAKSACDLLTGLHDLAIIPRGSGADNIRNITAPSTAGIDPQELIDVRPLAKELQHYILNHRELYGLPRKFNIAYDGGGTTGALEDTNDIGFAAVRVTTQTTAADGTVVAPGVYFRVALGGITGHMDFARDTGVLLETSQCLPVAIAMVRVFIEHGDRTDRKRARLKYLLDDWGFEKFLAETEKLLPFQLRRVHLAACQPRGLLGKRTHVGVHPQRQPGLSYVGVTLPVGRMTSDQMRRLAEIAGRYGSGTLRLTVWQNLLISDIPASQVEVVQRELRDAGLDWDASPLRAGLVACTGNAGCKYAAANTKRHALELAEYLDERVTLDQPLNIHLTGCPHSCAQHYIGDIGLLGTKVSVGDDLVEGYHVYVGGGYGAEQAIGRELWRAVAMHDLPERLEALLRMYVDQRHADESFRAFTQRMPIEALREVSARVETAGVADLISV